MKGLRLCKKLASLPAWRAVAAGRRAGFDPPAGGRRRRGLMAISTARLGRFKAVTSMSTYALERLAAVNRRRTASGRLPVGRSGFKAAYTSARQPRAAEIAGGHGGIRRCCGRCNARLME